MKASAGSCRTKAKVGSSVEAPTPPPRRCSCNLQIGGVVLTTVLDSRVRAVGKQRLSTASSNRGIAHHYVRGNQYPLYSCIRHDL